MLCLQSVSNKEYYMDLHDARWIIEALPHGRTPFAYFPDRYAHELLGWHVQAGMSMTDIKQGAFAHLLHRPSVKPIVARCGSGMADAAVFTNFWPRETLYFNLG